MSANGGGTRGPATHGRGGHTHDPWPRPELIETLRKQAGGRSSDLALVLGSGLGGIADRLENVWAKSAAEIEGYPVSTVAGHAGRLLLGEIDGRTLWVVQGRVHMYEGHPPERVTRYVRLLHALGVRTLLLTNAAGSVDPHVGAGELLLADDAISLFFRPLAKAGLEIETSITGARSVPRSDGPSESTGSVHEQSGRAATSETFASRHAWRARGRISDPDLAFIAQDVARREGVRLRRGTLVGSLGPNYETAAEVRAWRQLGGTVASMSTVPEAVQARELGIRCLLFSLVSNLATGMSADPLTHEDVVRVAGTAGREMERLLRALVGML